MSGTGTGSGWDAPQRVAARKASAETRYASTAAAGPAEEELLLSSTSFHNFLSPDRSGIGAHTAASAAAAATTAATAVSSTSALLHSSDSPFSPQAEARPRPGYTPGPKKSLSLVQALASVETPKQPARRDRERERERASEIEEEKAHTLTHTLTHAHTEESERESLFSFAAHAQTARGAHAYTPNSELYKKQVLSVLESPENPLFDGSAAGRIALSIPRERERERGGEQEEDDDDDDDDHTHAHMYAYAFTSDRERESERERAIERAQNEGKAVMREERRGERATVAEERETFRGKCLFPEDSLSLHRSWPVASHTQAHNETLSSFSVFSSHNLPSHTLASLSLSTQHETGLLSSRFSLDAHTQPPPPPAPPSLPLPLLKSMPPLTLSHLHPTTQHTQHSQHSQHMQHTPSLSLPPRTAVMSDRYASEREREREEEEALRPQISPEPSLLPTQHTRRARNYPHSNSLSHSHTYSQRDSRERESVDSSTTSLSHSYESLRFSQESLTTLSHNKSLHNSRTELVETPRSKNAFKLFVQRFKPFASKPFAEAEEFALREMLEMPQKIRWRVYVELAELAKKKNDVEKARSCYILACSAEPRASTTWLEWSKMEEENGRSLAALSVLQAGLCVCPLSDTLLPRSLKLHERLQLFPEIRAFLASVLIHEPIERGWKALLEGALFEARQGRTQVTRTLLHFLMTHIHWYGPVYHEAFRLEERDAHIHTHSFSSTHGSDAALAIIRKGLQELPRYGPLWFGWLRIAERADIRLESRFWLTGATPLLRNVSSVCADSVRKISKELTWRVLYERFQAEERAGERAAHGLFTQQSNKSWTLLRCRRHFLTPSRVTLTQALLLCPLNLRWKLLVAGARLELSLGEAHSARALLVRALREVPAKSQASVWIECSRCEEYLGHVECAESILSRAMRALPEDWRLSLERVLLSARSGDLCGALTWAKEAVRAHSGTGRLWALYVQLLHRYERVCERVKSESESVSRTLRSAVMQVPKSGEVWCEHARCLLNPLRDAHFDLARAQQSLVFAMVFTPQYGDSFIESVRVELLCEVMLRFLCENVLSISYEHFVCAVLSRDVEADCFVNARRVVETQSSSHTHQTRRPAVSRTDRRRAILNVLRMQYNFEKKLEPTREFQFPQLLRRCVNADPNYGSAWFHCRHLPYDLPSYILLHAQRVIRAEIESARLIYARAILLYVHRMCEEKDAQALFMSEQALEELKEDLSHSMDMLARQETVSLSGKDCPFLLYEVEDALFAPSDFVTGIVQLNRTIFNSHNPDELRRHFLFDVDQIVA